MEFTLDPPNFSPKHSASGCIIRSGKKVLFLQRKPKNYGETVWAIPAGKIEQGESPEQALKREVKEETDLDLENFYQLKKYEIRLHKKNYDFTYFLFEANIPENSKVKISDEHINYKWVDIDKVNELELESGAEVYIMIIQEHP